MADDLNQKPKQKQGHDVIQPDKGFIDVNEIFKRINPVVKELRKSKEQKDG